MSGVFDYINIGHQGKSKKEAIVDGILEAIEKNELARNEQLPSVNKFISKLGVARMTVVKALNVLKERGIIIAEDKVGYFVRDVNVKRELKVFIFLTGFNSYQETLYNHIIEGITAPNITIDLFFHHHNPKIFKSVLQENLGAYGLYIITGFNHPSVAPLLSKIPKNKLLQIIRPPVLEGVSSIHQDFYPKLKMALDGLTDKLRNYERFILIFPAGMGHPEEIQLAFVLFCEENNIAYSIEKKIKKDLITEGTAFWVIEDTHLISLIKMSEEAGFEIGKGIGILSYNETPMKEIIRNGITVVSADFVRMGQAIADFIVNPSYRNKIFPPEIISRRSM